MGWFKKAFGFSSQKVLAYILDPLQITGLGAAAVGQDVRPSIDGIKPDILNQTGRLTSEESEEIVKNTFSRLGRIFTSPMGLTGPFSTGKQKVFS